MSAIRIKGSEELITKLSEIANRLEDPQGASAAMREVIAQRFGQRFTAEGEGDWPELTARTLEVRARQGTSGSPRLNVTGALLSAVTGGRVQISPGQITYTADIPFYGAHLSERHSLPAFPLLRDDDTELVNELLQTLEQFVSEAMR